jgi:predicted esterase
MRSRASILAFLAAAALRGAPAPGPDRPFPEGAVVDRVACADSPAQSYALFLPPGFAAAAGRTWPILYLFDARARGPMAARLFAPAAGEQGFIVASSNDTESDGAMDPNITAFRAMWRDTHARFAIDPRRVYAGGFSGGARVAALMAATAPGAVAGVIGCGAGFHARVTAKPPFAWFGAVGNRDFNYDEVRELDATLSRLEAAHHVEVFDGDHGWPPPDVCARAIEWMQVQAERAGAVPRDAARAGRLMREFVDRATALAGAGRTLAAMNEYARAIADFRGTEGVSRLEQALAALESSPAGQRARRDEESRIANDDEIREKFTHVWGEIRSGDSVPEARLRQELGIAELRARAARSPGSEEALGAERLLSEIFVQTVFYLPRGYRAEKNWDRAILCASIAGEARPDSPAPRYEIAALHALAGRPDRALDELERAAALGFRDGDALEKDPDFTALRGQPRFRGLVDRLKTAPAAPAMSR